MSDYLERVNSLAELITSEAEQAEQQRRLTPAVLTGLHDGQFFRLLLPKPYAGEEISPPEFCQIIEAVAQIDASTAWCLCQANGCAMSAAYVDEAVANQIWGEDSRGVLAWGPGKGTAQSNADGEGYVLNGQWAFASGCRHATWLGAQSNVVDTEGNLCKDADGAIVDRTLLIPVTSATFKDIWDVIGLRATGSDGFAVTDLYVEQAYAVARDDPRARHYEAPLYLFPAMSLYASGFSGTALGIARTMLNAFKELAQGKTPRLAKQVLRDNTVVQNTVALAQIRLDAAKTFLLHELEDIWSDVLRKHILTIDQRMRIRLATTHAITEAKHVANAIYDTAGATAIFQSSPFERRFRDLHTVTQQLQGRQTHYQTVGAYLLGHEADLSVV